MPPNNPMTTWGNEKTMNLNMLVLTNIQSSPYFKVNLFELKTYHEVIDEIFYRVSHLEPWEKGSRKTSGQTGMCGGVRGVGAGGIVSSAYCLLYKLFTLKLTKKQLIGLITHKDSPYIRGLGFMYIRYTQPPADLWAWYEDYLDDEEEVDVKAGGGHVMTVGEMLRQWLVKLEWYSTLFPRIPVPIEKDLAAKLKTRPVLYQQEPEPEPEHIPDNQVSFGEAARRGGGGGGNDFRDDGARGNYQADNYRASREKDFRGSNDRDFRGSNDRDVRGSRDRDIRGSRDRDVRGSRDRDVRGSREKDIRGSREKDIRGSRDRDVRGGRDGKDGRDADYRRPSPSQRYNRSSPSHRSSASRRSRSPPSRRSPPRSFDRASSFERDLARERERHARKDRDHGRKEKKERSRSGERSSSHKHSHRDKDRHKEREERSSSHKHKNRDKDRR